MVTPVVSIKSCKTQGSKAKKFLQRIIIPDREIPTKSLIYWEVPHGYTEGLRNLRYILESHPRACGHHVPRMGQQRLALRVSARALQERRVLLLCGGHLGGKAHDPPCAQEFRKRAGHLHHARAGHAPCGLREGKPRSQGHQRSYRQYQALAEKRDGHSLIKLKTTI